VIFLRALWTGALWSAVDDSTDTVVTAVIVLARDVVTCQTKIQVYIFVKNKYNSRIANTKRRRTDTF
jgi:hypothetical protein